jgi:hypothetical protein
MTGCKSSFKELFITAYNLYESMEKNRNLVMIRPSKLSELYTVMHTSEDALPSKIIALREKLKQESGKLKIILDLFSYYAEVILDITSPIEALRQIDRIIIPGDPIYSRIVSMFTATGNEFFEKRLQNIIITVKENIQIILNQDKKVKTEIDSKSQDELKKLKELVFDQAQSIKLLQSQNTVLQKTITKKDHDLHESEQILQKTQYDLKLLKIASDDAHKTSRVLDEKLQAAQKLLKEFNDDKKELSKKLNDQINTNLKLNDVINENKKYLFIDPTIDSDISEKDIKELINYIISDMTLEYRYKAVTQILIADAMKSDLDACALQTVKIEIDDIYKKFSTLYREAFFESSKKSSDDELKNTKKLDDLKKHIELLAGKATAKILDCHNLRMFNSGFTKTAPTTVSDKESEASAKFKEKALQLEARHKAIAAFYEEILKRIENIEKNKLLPLANRTKHFAHRNYGLLLEKALHEQSKELQQIAAMKERVAKIVNS